MQIQTILHEADEGGHLTEVPALPGCVSQGETMGEVTSNIREDTMFTKRPVLATGSAWLYTGIHP